MASNSILLFAQTDITTNLLTQAEYSADPQRPIGNQPGVARSKLVNKVLRQTSLMSSGLAQMMADNQTSNIEDTMTPAEIATALEAALQTQFNLMLNNAQVVLPGSMMFWPKSTPPTGWLKRNGAAISRTTYANLYAVIGTTFGAGDGSTTFNLPDDRALFERGWDDGRGLDSGRTFGSQQSSQNLSHQHTGTTSTNGDHSHGIPSSGESGTAGGNIAGAYGHFQTPSTFAAGAHNHTFSTTYDGGSEARPVNRAYLPIIKY